MKRKSQNTKLAQTEHLKVELENGMTILNFVTSKENYENIVNGTMKQVSEYVKPSSEDQLVEHDEEGYEVVDEFGNAQPIKYDAIRFFAVHNKDQESALVKVVDAKCEVFADEKGSPIEYVVDENNQPVRDKDGNYAEPILDENGECINGRLYWLEQVAYSLGDVIG